MMEVWSVAALFLTLVAGIGIGLLGSKRLRRKRLEEAQREAVRLLQEAEKKAEILKKEALLQAKEEVYRLKTEFEKEMERRREEVQRLEKRLQQREANIDKKVDLLDAKEEELTKKERVLAEKERDVEEKEKLYQKLIEEERGRLEKISGISAEEAKKMLMEQMEEAARHDAAKRIKEIEEELKEQASRKAKEIITLAIQRYAGEYVAEKTVSLVNLPNEEMKGRIIGREGRNIRALEAATGVDLIIDDTPEAVILSAFNPIRREIARISLERLISDGRI
ncbi:MAG: ribonuclease Y, partial [Deltaproteobacteria bacterium]